MTATPFRRQRRRVRAMTMLSDGAKSRGTRHGNGEPALIREENGMATALQPSEPRVVLRTVSWETYEELNRALASLVENVAVEWRMSFRNLGLTTFKREDLGRGFEPDSCFYLRNAERMRGKTRIDLTLDPPPDLVIEIEITHPSLDKL